MIHAAFSVFATVVESMFLVYFLLLTSVMLFLNAVAAWSIRHYMARHPERNQNSKGAFSGFYPPISVIVPAYNEEATIATTIRSMLQLNYPSFEVIVVNDGSKDRTVDVAIAEFALQPFAEVHRNRIPTKGIRAVYRSVRHPNLRFIDKENGGKADALNAGINASVNPLFCGIDADSILQQDSLVKCVQPFLEDRRTICTGGTIRIANGCEVESGFLTRIGLPGSPLPLVQVVEYLRAFLFGRLGWSPMNALLIVSGAFGIFDREAVVKAGGYSTGTIGEDMELVVRLHRTMIEAGRPYRITYVPDPICWTEAPETLKVLANQRVRWQRGLAESLSRHRALLFKRGSGAVGWLSYPYLVAFELFEPLVEVGGLLFFLAGAWMGMVAWAEAILFLALVLVLGLLQTVNAILLEEISYRNFRTFAQILSLVSVAFLEAFGYRQLNTWWRLKGLVLWMTKRRQTWGEMTRTASWSTPTGGT